MYIFFTSHKQVVEALKNNGKQRCLQTEDIDMLIIHKFLNL